MRRMLAPGSPGLRVMPLSKSSQVSHDYIEGEMGIPTVLSAPKWGYYDVLFKGNQFEFDRDYGSYVMENVLFKISYPAEFHAQTAVEAAVTLHQQVVNRLWMKSRKST